MDKDLKDLKIFGGSSHPELVDLICKQLDVEAVPVYSDTYPNENQWVRIGESIRGHPVFIIQTSCLPVDRNIIQMLLLIDAARRGSAEQITAVCPYFPYVRSDKKDEPRISIAAQLMCEMIQAAGAERIVAIELHSPQVQGFAKIFDNLHAGSRFCEALQGKLEIKDVNQFRQEFVVVSADIGRDKLNKNLAKKMGLRFAATIDKERVDTHKVEGTIIGDVKGKNVLIFDDEILTGSTVINAARLLLEEGEAKNVHACAFHGVFAPGAIERIENSPLNSVIVTNTIPQKTAGNKIKIVDISGLLADTIKKIYLKESVSALF